MPHHLRHQRGTCSGQDPIREVVPGKNAKRKVLTLANKTGKKHMGFIADENS